MNLIRKTQSKNTYHDSGKTGSVTDPPLLRCIPFTVL